MQRKKMLPSEKAFSYKMKLEALKHQGKSTSGQVVQKWSVQLVGEEARESYKQVQRYIRLTNLTPELLKLVDDGRIALNPAVELSYLTKEQQRNLYETIQSEETTPSLAQAKKLREWSENGLNMDVIFSILTDKKPNQKEKLSFDFERLRSFFPEDYTPKEIEKLVYDILDNWKQHQQQRNNQNRDAR